METLVAKTSRVVTFSHDGQTKRFAEGTEVYVTERRDGTFRVRVPGTLFTQDVTVNALLVP